MKRPAGIPSRGARAETGLRELCSRHRERRPEPGETWRMRFTAAALPSFCCTVKVNTSSNMLDPIGDLPFFVSPDSSALENYLSTQRGIKWCPTGSTH